ncbi:MAG: response regulator transcription factor [Acidobacteria bacterium]|nr:response regulator transcription factor [Acidobacteriota bacterium]MCG3193697.1 KDP operon transcriptional regulatory protein KdpE [Thermoanaerobaculia bacterium]
MSKILVVDDDIAIRKGLRDALIREGHEVVTAADGEEAMEAFLSETFDLVVTDLAMPGKDGFSLLRSIRHKSDVPVLILTVRGEEREKVRLLDAGADDYIVKPFGLAEFLARTRTVLRRRTGVREAGEVIQIGSLAIDLAARRVERGGQEQRLTPTEFTLLKTFLSRPGIVWTHRQLIATVWGSADGATSDALRVQIGSLRRKIEENPDQPRLIRTEPWVGYRFVTGE